MHHRIYDAYRNGDYQAAGDLMKAHLEDSLKYALEHLK